MQYYLDYNIRQSIKQAIEVAIKQRDAVVKKLPYLEPGQLANKITNDLVINEIIKKVENNPDLQLEPHLYQAGSHRYLVLYDRSNDINILIQKEKRGRKRFKPANYRKQLSQNNKVTKPQLMLRNSPAHNIQLPDALCVVVSYKEDASDIVEGMLKKDGQSWIYRLSLLKYNPIAS